MLSATYSQDSKIFSGYVVHVLTFMTSLGSLNAPPQRDMKTTSPTGVKCYCLSSQTPKETTPSAVKAFFQTPGTLGNVVSAVPAARKRGSAQRRLDVGHLPTSQAC